MSPVSSSSAPVIGVIGLGYVGLPLAVALARAFDHVIGFDINSPRVAALQAGDDATGEVEAGILAASRARFSDDPADLAACSVYIVTVPTPVDANHQPDLGPLKSACATLAPLLKRDDLIIFESTVYPGVTEEVCGPELARLSGLTQGFDFRLGYSPERINPGDKERRLETITKIISGEDAATLARVEAIYAPIIKAGLHKAPSIKVAEAAKVIENTQRDLNIAFMNEIAMIFGRLGIRTADVLAAAGTKWNFLPFTPGLVGGHCISIDPYYLTARADLAGYYPDVILTGRRINDDMGRHIADEAVRLICKQGFTPADVRVAVMGITFKEDVPDIRNSRVPDIIERLASYGIKPKVYDHFADAAEVQHEFGIKLAGRSLADEVDVILLAVPHAPWKTPDARKSLLGRFGDHGGILMDIKSILPPQDMPKGVKYWSL